MSYRPASLAWAIFVLFGIGLIFGACSLVQAAGLAETPWPMYRHDPGHTGFNGAKGPTTDHLKWVFSAGKAEKLGGFSDASLSRRP